MYASWILCLTLIGQTPTGAAPNAWQAGGGQVVAAPSSQFATPTSRPTGVQLPANSQFPSGAPQLPPTQPAAGVNRFGQSTSVQPQAPSQATNQPTTWQNNNSQFTGQLPTAQNPNTSAWPTNQSSPSAGALTQNNNWTGAGTSTSQNPTARGANNWPQQQDPRLIGGTQFNQGGATTSPLGGANAVVGQPQSQPQSQPLSQPLPRGWPQANAVAQPSQPAGPTLQPPQNALQQPSQNGWGGQRIAQNNAVQSNTAPNNAALRQPPTNVPLNNNTGGGQLTNSLRNSAADSRVANSDPRLTSGALRGGRQATIAPNSNNAQGTTRPWSQIGGQQEQPTGVQQSPGGQLVGRGGANVDPRLAAQGSQGWPASAPGDSRFANNQLAPPNANADGQAGPALQPPLQLTLPNGSETPRSDPAGTITPYSKIQPPPADAPEGSGQFTVAPSRFGAPQDAPAERAAAGVTNSGQTRLASNTNDGKSNAAGRLPIPVFGATNAKSAGQTAGYGQTNASVLGGASNPPSKGGDESKDADAKTDPSWVVGGSLIASFIFFGTTLFFGYNWFETQMRYRRLLVEGDDYDEAPPRGRSDDDRSPRRRS